MPVIKHGDREIHYKHHDLIPHIKIFHQDFSPFGPGTDYAVQAVSAGKAREDMERLGDNHIKTYYALRPFIEEPPTLIPSYDYIIYDGREKKFPFMDIIDAGILAPNQMILSYRLLGFLQKHRMAPYITAPVVVKHRDTFIEDYYVMVYFWHHGCDLVDWENTVFEYIDPISEAHISTFTINSFDEYKIFRKKVSTGGIYYKPLSIFFKDKYDIYYCDIKNLFISTQLRNEIKSLSFKNLWISGGGYFETKLNS